MVGPDILIEGLGFRVLEAGCYRFGEGLGFVYFEAKFRLGRFGVVFVSKDCFGGLGSLKYFRTRVKGL